MKKTLYFLFFISVFSSSLLRGQDLTEARELYKIGEYKKALPIFEKEYNLKPTDATLNHWYGVCLFETGGNLKKAEELITLASKKGIQDAYYYLGKIYTNTYRFKEANQEFERYAKLKRRDKVALARLEVDKERLTMLMRSASRPEDIQIIDSVVVDKANFLSAYKLSLSSGKLFDTSSSSDGTSSIVYLNEKGSKMYFSEIQDNGLLALFSKEKLMDEFGNKKPLSDDNFGLSGNLNYPFMMSDGVTIYFSAEDEDGFGGYDIYVTRYNLNNDTYLNPERLNMPFNSIANDYMYVIDEEKGIGWFATDRFQEEGKVCVYTFIPNETVQILESENNDYLISRAKISSIKDTWKPEVNYTKKIALARKEAIEEKQINKDFEFVINDKFTYYTLSDFKNKSARSLYQSVLDSSTLLKEVNSKLDKLRDLYHSSPSNAIAQEILSLEGQKYLLIDEIRDIEVKARNQEIGSI